MQIQSNVPVFPVDGLGPERLYGDEARDYMRSLQDLRTPQVVADIERITPASGRPVWRDYARQLSAERGVVRGTLARAELAVSSTLALVTAHAAKLVIRMPRPYQLDPTLRVVGELPKSASLPSAHAAVAAASADTLAKHWPARAGELQLMATAMQQARMIGGVHSPFDVQIGAKFGHAAATTTRTLGMVGLVAAPLAGAALIAHHVRGDDD